MGCVASSPQVDDAPHKPGLRHGESAEGEPTPAAEVFRGGGKGVDRATAESSRRALRQILSGRHRDWLLDASGKKVKIDALKGAPMGILFTAQTIPQARKFQRLLLSVTEELRLQGRPFEVVVVSNDETEELWRSAIADTPWLTIPLKDTATVDAIGTRFEIGELPTFILLDREGKVVTKDGIEAIKKMGAAAWPFSTDNVGAPATPTTSGAEAGA